MTATDTILAIISTLLGSTTLMGYLLYRGANRRIKAAEASKSEVGVEKALREMYEDTLVEMRKEYVERINELKASLDEANKRYRDLLVSSAKKDDIIEDKTGKIRELNEVVYALQQKITGFEVRISGLESELDWQRLWHCSREYPTNDMTEEQRCEGCARRKPQQPIPLKYIPFKKAVKK